MKDFNNIDREIEVVENVIRLLRDCLAISMKHKRKAECKSTLKDIELCEEELKRLVGIRSAKNKAYDEAKEQAQDNAAVQRSGKRIF